MLKPHVFMPYVHRWWETASLAQYAASTDGAICTVQSLRYQLHFADPQVLEQAAQRQKQAKEQQQRQEQQSTEQAVRLRDQLNQQAKEILAQQQLKKQQLAVSDVLYMYVIACPLCPPLQPEHICVHPQETALCHITACPLYPINDASSTEA